MDQDQKERDALRERLDRVGEQLDRESAEKCAQIAAEGAIACARVAAEAAKEIARR